MKITFRNQVSALKDCMNSFDPASQVTKINCLKNLSALPLVINEDLLHYFDTLLFLTAYPGDPAQLNITEKELSRISAFLHRARKEMPKQLVNTGMPHTKTITRFSHDKVRWLLHHPECNTTLEDFVDPTHTLNDVLMLTLPTIERAETTAGLENMDLMDALKVPSSKRLWFIINELSRLDDQPYIKDHLYERLEPIVCITPKDKAFSKAYNRWPVGKTYFHLDLLKRIDSSIILQAALPSPVQLNAIQKEKAIRVVKNAMVLTARETDPCTYMDENSFRMYHLERGISVAIFGMVSSRQMPLESYVGYTAFKNGFPVSYGGAWIFGERANFGINIFKPYRSGESAFIMAQLLRVYRHVFNLHYFEVEPYQYGLDNPDGIASGAFWFYYRFGFRPLDKKLKEVALREAEKISTRKGYRTSHRVLTSFTTSNIGLRLGDHTPPAVTDIGAKVTAMIHRTYKGDRILAENDCRQKFMAKTRFSLPSDPAEKHVLTEVALWAEAMYIDNDRQLDLMKKMITTKPVDVYAYQDLLLRYSNPAIG